MKALLIQQFPILQQQELLAEITDVSELIEASEGTVLMDVGQYIKFMPLVLEGVIKVIREDEDGNEMLLYYLEGGKTCAMSMTCCMQQVQSNIRAVVVEDAKFVAIPVQYVDEWMMKFSAWKNFILNTYQNRFDQLLGAIDVIAFKKMDERLLSYLKKRISVIEEPFVAATHQEMASELNTSREVVSRMLKKLEMEGSVTNRKGKFYVP